MASALHNAGLRKAAEVRPGDRFTATFTGFGQAKPGMNAPKLFEYVIEPRSASDLAMNQPQQPGMQQAQQDTRSSSTRPSSPCRPRIRDIATWSTHGTLPTQQQPQQPAQPVQLGQPQQQADPMKVNQLKAVGKSPQEIAGLLGVPVEAVTAVTDQAQPQYHGGSEQMPETGEF